MFIADVPLAGGALADLPSGGEGGGGELTHLLTAASSEQVSLPCRAHDPDLWFAESPAELERAKQLCAPCPVRAECLTSALSREEPWGVWGGEIFEHGVVIPRKRPRGRPSKAALERDRIERAEQARSGQLRADPEPAGAERPGAGAERAEVERPDPVRGAAA